VSREQRSSTVADLSKGFLDIARRSRVPTARSGGIDAFRGLSVLGMLLVHAERVFPPGPGAPLDSWRTLLKRGEPFVSACFLFLVGLSLTLSWHRFWGETSRSDTDGAIARTWRERGWRRACVLYLGGVVLFALQYGFELPDAVVCPDILSVIALAIVLLGALIPKRPLMLWGMWVGVLGASWALDSAQLGVPGLNTGPGGVIPILAFACAGALWGLARRDQSNARLTALVGLAGLVSACALALPGNVSVEYPSVYTLGATGTLTTVWFWNHSLKGVLLLSGPLALCALSFTTLPWLWHSRWVAPLRLLGRHALVVYVGHLLALGVVDRWLRPEPGALSLPVALLVLLAGFTLVALLLESGAGQLLQGRIANRVGIRL
jgi:hypothetical protein